MEEALHELDIRINSCGISDCPADWSWNTVGFPDYDLWTVLRGKGTIICGGEPMEITAGKSFLLCPNTQYNASHDVNDRLLALNVHFCRETWRFSRRKPSAKLSPIRNFIHACYVASSFITIKAKTKVRRNFFTAL